MEDNIPNEPKSSRTPWLRRFVGLILIITAVFGWLLSLGGIAALWSSKPVVTTTSIDLVDSITISLDATEQMLAVLNLSLQQARSSLDQVASTLDDFGETIGATSSVLQSISDIIGNDFVDLLNNTVVGLSAMEKTSQLIDNTLIFVSAIPFFGGSQYRPEVPLSKSVAGLSADLKEMPVSLSQISKEMEMTATSLEPVPGSLEVLSAELIQVKSNLENAEKLTVEYQRIIDDYQGRMEAFQNNLPGIIQRLFLVITLFILWVAFAQIGLFTQGLERLRENRK
jgi:hypothetical protein